MRYPKTITVAILISLVGCATDDPNRRAKTGATIGAIAGAIIGSQANDSNRETGAIVGAIVGGISGAAVGNYMDKQQREMEDKLAQEQQQKAVEIERLQDNTLKLSLNNEVSFDFNRAEIKPSFQPTLDKLASVINEYPQTIVHIVGHTDNIGSDSYNYDLSFRRAQAVQQYLMGRGVLADRLRIEGRGESEPRASNQTEAGRQLNRRVEIYLKPLVEGQEQRAYQPPH